MWGLRTADHFAPTVFTERLDQLSCHIHLTLLQFMPRVMTMNGDHQSAASAPIEDTGAHRSSPVIKGCATGPRMGSSPAPPACTGTDGSGVHSPSVRASPDTETSPARKRPTDKISSKLPFRKRKIAVEPEQTQSVSGERTSSADDTDSASQRSSERPEDEIRTAVAQVTPWRRSPGTYPWPPNYVVPMYCPPWFPESHHPLAYLHENVLLGISLATHQDEDGDTALHIAVVQGRLTIVSTIIQLLLLAGRDLDIYNNLRQTPLHLAVITKQPNIVEALLRAGADPAALDRHGQTAFHLCCEYDQRDCLSLSLSLSSSSTCLETKNFDGLSPLHLAVLRGHKDLAKMLLDAGANINAMDIKSGQSPLMHAVETNNADMVHFLIENGCGVNTQSYSGNTALHIACGRGQVDIVRLLLKSGADSSLKNYHNDTPVMVAKNKKIADVLRGRGSKQIRPQDHHCVSVLQHGSTFMENGSSSPNHSRGSSPSTPHTLHHNSAHTPQTPSAQFRYY